MHRGRAPHIAPRRQRHANGQRTAVLSRKVRGCRRNTPRYYPDGAFATPMRQAAGTMALRLSRTIAIPRSEYLYAGSLATIALCIALWIRERPSAKTSAQTLSGARCSSAYGRQCSG